MNIVEEIINTAKREVTITNFKYYNDFFTKWENFLNKTYSSIVNYEIYNVNDSDQCYIYSVMFGTQHFDFHFSIKYLRDFLYYCANNNIPLRKIELSNTNGELAHGNFKCNYDKSIDVGSLKHSSSYNDLEHAIVVPFPIGEYSFVAVDGNHRIGSQVNENKKSITATYLDYQIVANSLYNSLEIAIYCFIEDFQKIRHNLGKFKDTNINNSLNINNPKKNLSIISERNKKCSSK